MNKLDILRDKLYEANYDLTKLSMYLYSMEEQKIRIGYVGRLLEELCDSMSELKDLWDDYVYEEDKSEQLML